MNHRFRKPLKNVRASPSSATTAMLQKVSSRGILVKYAW